MNTSNYPPSSLLFQPQTQLPSSFALMSTSEFTICSLKREHFDEVFEFMQDHFRVQEPITVALGTTYDDSAVFYRDLCRAGFKTSGLSLAARNAAGELIGLVLNSRYASDELSQETAKEKTDFTEEIDRGPYDSRCANRLVVFIEHVEAGLRDQLPTDTLVFKMDILAVRTEYCRKGIGRELVDHSIQLAKQMNCTMIACATAQASQQLFRTRGFKTVRSVSFSDFSDRQELIYAEVPGDAARLMILSPDSKL